MRIAFAGQELILHPSGVALWPRHGLLIVSDLHLEKGSHFARRGFFLPPYDSIETLQKLLAVCAATGAARVLVLGDCFHDPGGYARLPADAQAAFARLMAYRPVWIRGNHDRDFVPPGLEAHDSYALDGLVFRHEAAAVTEAGEVSGHFHPKALLRHKDARIARPCFVEDGARLMLPAFGVYTGGLFVTDPAIAGLFTPPARLYLTGQRKVYRLDAQMRGITAD